MSEALLEPHCCPVGWPGALTTSTRGDGDVPVWWCRGCGRTWRMGLA